MNSVDILATLASKVDSTILNTTASKTVSFKNSSGNTIMYLDDLLNVQMNGFLTNTGGAQFNNGLQVAGGGGITYDANNSLQVSSLGTQVNGQFSFNNNLTGTNANQTTIVCNKLLNLQQNGDSWCDTNLYLAGRSGTLGLQLENTSTNATYGFLDFVYSVNTKYRSWRLETRTAYARTGVPSLQYCISGDTVAPAVSMGDTYTAINKVAIGSYTDPGTNALSVTGNATVSGNLTVSTNTTITGTLAYGGATVSGDATITGKIIAATMNVSAFANLPGYMFCAGTISATGSKLVTTGQVSFTVARLSGYAAGGWLITFASAHPLGANYVVNVTPRNAAAYICFNPAPTTTTFAVTLIGPGTAAPTIDAIFSFMVLAS